MIGEDIVHRGLHLGGIKESDGRVRLRVEIDEEGFLFLQCESSSEVDGGGSFTDAAFLIGNCDDASQAVPLANPRLATIGLHMAAPGPSPTMSRLTVLICPALLQAKNAAGPRAGALSAGQAFGHCRPNALKYASVCGSNNWLRESKSSRLLPHLRRWSLLSPRTRRFGGGLTCVAPTALD